jgi:glutamyl-tRNA synthetase/nondiscriminating glutamyl-tRNA synthetase
MRVRFAPSPTGHLHVGNARTALFNWLLARGSGGSFILRIEDTDAERSTRESEDAIVEDLRWLGLDWDEGPGTGGAHGPYRQSERLSLYRDHARRLLDAGHAYYCFCSPERLEAERQEAVAAGRIPKYSGRCRDIPLVQGQARVTAGERAVVRFHVRGERDVVFDDVVRGRVSFHTSVIGDPVLLRSDGVPAYNFAVVVDDGLMEVTHVVRGEDHISNTPRQVLFYEAFGWTPPAFAHLALVMGPDHTPLSKRHGATSVAEFRAKGYLPEALVNYLALLGWSPGGEEELLPVEELARRFGLDAVGHSAAVFDEEKLAWVNRHYLRLAPPERLAELSTEHLRRAGMAVRSSPEGSAYLASVIGMASGSVDRLEQVPARLRFLFHFDPAASLQDSEVQMVVGEDGALEVIESLSTVLASVPPLTDRESFRAAVQEVKRLTGRKARALFHPIRVALTGQAGGPELDQAVPAIDRGAALPEGSGLSKIISCRERARRFSEALRS